MADKPIARHPYPPAPPRGERPTPRTERTPSVPPNLADHAEGTKPFLGGFTMPGGPKAPFDKEAYLKDLIASGDPSRYVPYMQSIQAPVSQYLTEGLKWGIADMERELAMLINYDKQVDASERMGDSTAKQAMLTTQIQHWKTELSKR